MLTLHISEADVNREKYERYSYPSAIVQKRLHVLYIKSETYLSHQQIASVVGVHRELLSDYGNG